MRGHACTLIFFFSSRRRHTRCSRDWSSDVCSSDLACLVRWSACSKLGFIGLKLNEKRNARPSPDEDIAASDSPVRVLVIRAQEDWAIARECWKLTSTGKASQLTR